MNIGEASDVQALLSYLLDRDRGGHPDALTAAGRAYAAAARLAGRARTTLGAGWDGRDVDARWLDFLERLCPGTDDCPIHPAPALATGGAAGANVDVAGVGGEGR